MCRSSKFVCFSLMLLGCIVLAEGTRGASARPIGMVAMHARPPIMHQAIPFSRGPLTPASTGGPSGALAGSARSQTQQATQIAAFARAGGLAHGPRGFGYDRYRRDDGGLGYGDSGYGGLGYGGYGGYGAGEDLGLGVPSPRGAGYGLDTASPAYEPTVIPAPLPCTRPRFISVLGRGVRHHVATRVVYGAPSPCGF